MLRRLLEPSTCICERTTSCGYVTRDAVAWATEEAPTCSCTPSLQCPVSLPPTPCPKCCPVRPPNPNPTPEIAHRPREPSTKLAWPETALQEDPTQKSQAQRGPVGGPAWALEGQAASGAASLQGRRLTCLHVLRKPLKGPEPAICMWLRTTSCG